MIVAPRGKDDHATSWEAGSDVPWLTVSDAVGEGRGRFAYELSGEGVRSGLNETTLDVTLAGVGDAFEIPVSLYATPLRIEEVRKSGGFGVAGWSMALPDSLPPGLTGFGADSAVWSAEASGPGGLVVERAEGGSDEPIVWRRDSKGLEAGVYEDTITILVRGHPEVKRLIVDRVEVVGAIGVEDAAFHLLGVDRLDPGQVRFLDWFGNRDGTLNAGDVLRWLDHCAEGGTDPGCTSGPRTVPVRIPDRRPPLLNRGRHHTLHAPDRFRAAAALRRDGKMGDMRRQAGGIVVRLLLGDSAGFRSRLRFLLLALAAVGAPSVGIAQENDEILARMEFDRMRLFSGPNQNLADMLQRARLQKLAMPPVGALPTALRSAGGVRSGPIG